MYNKAVIIMNAWDIGGDGMAVYLDCWLLFLVIYFISLFSDVKKQNNSFSNDLIKFKGNTC